MKLRPETERFGLHQLLLNGRKNTKGMININPVFRKIFKNSSSSNSSMYLCYAIKISLFYRNALPASRTVRREEQNAKPVSKKESNPRRSEVKPSERGRSAPSKNPKSDRDNHRAGRAKKVSIFCFYPWADFHL